MSKMIERLRAASRLKNSRGGPLKSVVVTVADLSALLAWVEDARKGLEPFREAATHVPADQDDFKIMGHVPGGLHADAYRRMGANLTAGNLRNAAALLARLEGK